MTFLQNLTDDQTSMFGCAVLLFFAFLLMSVSYHVGVIVRGARTLHRPANQAGRTSSPAVEVHRRAA